MTPFLRSILVENGDLVQYGQPLLLIDEEQSLEATHEYDQSRPSLIRVELQLT